MTLRHAAAVLAVLSLAPGVSAQELPRPPIALTHANVLDVKTGKVLGNATVVLRDGRIESIGAGAAAPAGVTAIDVRANTSCRDSWTRTRTSRASGRRSSRSSRA